MPFSRSSAAISSYVAPAIRSCRARRRSVVRRCDRLVSAGVSLGSSRSFGRGRAVEAFLHGLTSPQPNLPHGPSYRTLAKKTERWVDEGLARTIAWYREQTPVLS